MRVRANQLPKIKLRMSRWSVYLAAAVILSAGIFPAHAQQVPDEQFVGIPPSNVSTVPHYGFTANGMTGFTANINFLMGINADGDIPGQSKVTAVGFCKSLADSMCAKAQIVRYQATLNFCKDNIQVDCIKDFSIVDAQGKKLEYLRSGSFPGARSEDYVGSPEVGLPGAGPAPLLSIPSLPHSGGDKYLIVASLDGRKMPGQKVFSAPNLNVSVYATRIDPSPLSPPGVQTDLKWFDKLGLETNGFGNPTVSCPIYGWDGCAQKYELPTNVSFGVTLKLSSPVSGWLHGRVSDVNSSISIDNAGYQEIRVQGKPLVLPTVYSWVEKSKASKSLSDFYTEQPKPLGGSGYGCLDAVGQASCGPRPAELWVSVMRTADPNPNSMQEFLAWLPHLDDKATTAPTIWRFETMSNYGVEDQCFRNSSNLSGFVATNATQYLAGPPVLNKQEQTLDYKVAAPHYLPNGTEFLGTYDLQIRSDVARCLYGFTDAPISASIAVTSADGQEKIATTQLVERDGWLNFSAKGFTFSNPTIRVKLTQKSETPLKEDALDQATESKSQVQSATVPKTISGKVKKSITCVKGNKIRKVSGINPKCPTGFRRR